MVCHIPPPNASMILGNGSFARGGAEIDERRETRMETRRRETIRLCGLANVSSSHVSARLSSIVSRPRAHTHLAGGGCVRGTSHIAIGEMAGIWREIMVRNVVFGGIAARPEGSPHHGSAGRLAPPLAPAAAVAGRPPGGPQFRRAR